MVKTIIGMVLLVWLVACNGAARRDYVQTPIEKTGVFEIKQGKYRLTLAKTAENLIAYDVTSGGKTIIHGNDRASDYQRWGAYWDGDDTFWFYSSDVGIFAWLPGKAGVYEEQIVMKGSALDGRIPDQVWARLPKAMR